MLISILFICCLAMQVLTVYLQFYLFLICPSYLAPYCYFMEHLFHLHIGFLLIIFTVELVNIKQVANFKNDWKKTIFFAWLSFFKAFRQNLNFRLNIQERIYFTLQNKSLFPWKVNIMWVKMQRVPPSLYQKISII